MEDNRLSRVEMLIQHKKFNEAETLLANLLREESNNIHYLSLLSEVFLEQDKSDQALEMINNAIGLSPDHPFLFYIKSRILIQQDKYGEAENSINDAIALDPGVADYFAILANIKLIKKQYQEALNNADKALELDAENLLALNMRSTALTKLDRAEESFETIEGALRGDPNNAFTHANYGWSLLEKGHHQKALEHFKEALSKDPNFSYAQAGVIEALKAKNLIYRLFLKYAFFMGNLTSKYQWGVIIGFYFGFKGLRVLARNNEALQPYLTPLIIALAILAFSTWVIEPISNLFLRFNKYGQYLLDEKEKFSSNFVAMSLGLFILASISYLILWDEKLLLIAAFGFAMMLPLASMFAPSKNKNALLIYTIVLAILGFAAIGYSFVNGEMFNLFSIGFVLAFFIYQWFANYMVIKESNFN
jgi:tetratricopeptide (TPR) repeat protein